MDNASGNDSAIRHLTNKLKNWRNDGKVDNNIVSICNAVKYVRSSTTRLQTFKIRVEQEKILGPNGQISQGSVMRWNFTYVMLMTALKFKPAFDRMTNEDKLYDAYCREEEGTVGSRRRMIGPMGSDDWENAQRMVRFLRIFYNVTLEFSVSLRVTSSNYYNDICKVEKALNSIYKNVNPHLKGMTLSMKEKFDKYWKGILKINKLLIVATVLDPRSKMNFIVVCFESLYDNDSAKCGEMKSIVKNTLHRLYEAYTAKHPSASVSVIASASQASGCGFNSGLTFLDFGDADDDYEDPFSKYTKMDAETRDNIRLSNELDLNLMKRLNFKFLIHWVLNLIFCYGGRLTVRST
ncbi:zinc finger BED domain-containing protein RICESLEEPER 2-like [Citrus clementina]|uniref:zinc finger BED domain-containing protein RICESLEEPER 2-like n=1 Tax=Citrus clementina TaxID=85681 RepID=UPI000CED57C8|nr:zinc finger BED domain-containing protein RICESLEEPER 2-like [Citrus x clementina]